MTEHYSTGRASPLSKAFNYYSEVEKYRERYSRYCVKVDVAKRTDSTILTNEMWNMNLNDLDHVKVKVKYELKPPNEICYEILEGYGKGSKNCTKLNETKDDHCGARVSLVPLEIYSKFYPLEDPVFQKMALYFSRMDSKYCDGKTVETVAGDPCPSCKKGKLKLTGKRSTDDSPSESHSEREFVCDFCGEIITHHEIGLKENLKFSDSVSVEKNPKN